MQLTSCSLWFSCKLAHLMLLVSVTTRPCSLTWATLPAITAPGSTSAWLVKCCAMTLGRSDSTTSPSMGRCPITRALTVCPTRKDCTTGRAAPVSPSMSCIHRRLHGLYCFSRLHRTSAGMPDARWMPTSHLLDFLQTVITEVGNMRKPSCRDASRAAARQAQQHAKPRVDAPHRGAVKNGAHGRQTLGQRCIDEIALDAQGNSLGGCVHEQDARPQPLPGAECALPVGRRQLL